MSTSDQGGGPSGARPSWQRAPCPGWCARTHHEDDHVEDRYHQSEPSFVPVLVATQPTVPVTESLQPVDLVVRIGQYVDELVEWVAIEPIDLPQPRMVVTLESAHTLARALAEQLERHAAG